jgi:phosphohistidine phosphatase
VIGAPPPRGFLVVLVHHADAVGPHVDPQRPLSQRGIAQAERLAVGAKAGGIAPAVIWHSGKLRARQTAERFLRACNPLADFRMVRGLRPEDPPDVIRDALAAEERDVLLVSHMPLLPTLLEALVGRTSPFPLNGLVVLERKRENDYEERWRAGPDDPTARE